MSEVIQFNQQSNSQSDWWELLQDATIKVGTEENALQAPTFEFKKWFEIHKMKPGERCQYMIDLRDYYAEKARYAQQHTWMLEYAGQS